MFLDADDYFIPKKFKIFIDYVEKFKIKIPDIIRVGIKYISNNYEKHVIPKIKFYKNIDKAIIENYFFMNFPLLSNFSHVYKKEFLIKNNLKIIENTFAEDAWFLIKCYEKRPSTLMYNDWYYVYDNTNLSSITNKNSQENKNTFIQLYKDLLLTTNNKRLKLFILKTLRNLGYPLVFKKRWYFYLIYWKIDIVTLFKVFYKFINYLFLYFKNFLLKNKCCWKVEMSHN